ncbi:MAG: Alpha/beta hydrolase family protein [Alphaproteobacteria bacterium]|jgi:dipeptidyl aminopeptidase/acylaminoacyl peptidase|nr:Alpha/beta hydrolase family protein [Alphaproteobacteria bacterium]
MVKRLWYRIFFSIQILSFSCGANPYFIKNSRENKKQVEYFVKYPPKLREKNPLIILIHGHQEGLRPGGKDFFEDGSLERYAQKGFIAVSISQPGYGKSDGSPDFCGPLSQAALKSVITIFKKRSDVNPDKVFLYGISRGAVVAAMVATQDPSLGGIILNAGIYNLRTVIGQKNLPNITKVAEGMIANIEKEAGLNGESMHLRSAVDYVTKIKSPVLMFHGINDDRNPVSQAKEFHENLLKSGVSAELYLFPCGHCTPIEERKLLVDKFLDKRISNK